MPKIAVDFQAKSILHEIYMYSYLRGKDIISCHGHSSSILLERCTLEGPRMRRQLPELADWNALGARLVPEASP